MCNATVRRALRAYGIVRRKSEQREYALVPAAEPNIMASRPPIGRSACRQNISSRHPSEVAMISDWQNRHLIALTRICSAQYGQVHVFGRGAFSSVWVLRILRSVSENFAVTLY